MHKMLSDSSFILAQCFVFSLHDFSTWKRNYSKYHKQLSKKSSSLQVKEKRIIFTFERNFQVKTAETTPRASFVDLPSTEKLKSTTQTVVRRFLFPIGRWCLRGRIYEPLATRHSWTGMKRDGQQYKRREPTSGWTNKFPMGIACEQRTHRRVMVCGSELSIIFLWTSMVLGNELAELCAKLETELDFTWRGSPNVHLKSTESRWLADDSDVNQQAGRYKLVHFIIIARRPSLSLVIVIKKKQTFEELEKFHIIEFQSHRYLQRPSQ